MGLLQVRFKLTHLAPQAARSLVLFSTKNNTANMSNNEGTMPIFSDDTVGIRVSYGDWVVQIGAILSDHIAVHQLLSGLCILTMGLCIRHVLGSKTLASSPIFVAILVFAAIILVSSAIDSSAVMAMPKGDCRVPASESL